MLTYLLSGAVALVVGTGGGFLGGRLANANLRRSMVGLGHSIDNRIDNVILKLDQRATREDLRLLEGRVNDRPTNDNLQSLYAAFQGLVEQQQAMTQVVVTRDEMKPILAEVITRPELDQALQAVVVGISRNIGLPLPAAAPASDAVALAGASGDQLAATIARLSQQMGQINQQLGLG